jgi:TDG/mug DNA glycosylase family protein
VTEPILPDVLAPGLRLVVCGTAPGTRSARDRAYYAHPQNEFWGVMHRGGVTPGRLAPQDYRKLPNYGVGLTDICKHVFGADSVMTRDDFDPEGLAQRVAAAAPGILAFNGKFSAKHFLRHASVPYGLLPDRIGETRLYVAPSTSKLARRYWDEEIWMDLLRMAGFRPLQTVAGAEP